MTNSIEAKITSGVYEGDPIIVSFGKPLKVYVAGKDVSDKVLSLTINISIRGWLVNIEFAETSKELIGGEKHG